MADYVFEMLTGTDWRAELKQRHGETWHRVTGGKLQRDVLIRLGKVDGRLVCTGLTLGLSTPDDEVSARGLREVPLGEIMAAVGAQLAGAGDYDSALHKAVAQHYAKQMLEGTAHEFSGRPARPGPSGWPREHYERVAATYREALVKAPKAPVEFVRAAMHTTEPTARRWIKTARDKGLLGESMPGRAGEKAVTREAGA
jgi:hypothetical protein